MKGIVMHLNYSKRYGFIKAEDDSYVFVHHQGFKSLIAGDTVSFDVEKGDKGQKAVNVIKQ